MKKWNVYYTFKTSTGKEIRKYVLVNADTEDNATRAAINMLTAKGITPTNVEKPEVSDGFYI